MSSHDYKGFLQDLSAELIQLTKDSEIYEQGDFYRGYRSALYAVIHLLENQADSWEIDRGDVGIAHFSADDWRRTGKGYSSD